MKTIQLRRYYVSSDDEDRLVEAWALRIRDQRRAHGFGIEFAYLDRDHHVFVWAVSVEGDRDLFFATERAYLDAKDASTDSGPSLVERAEVAFVDDHTPASAPS
ncbi:MAG TPA: hypothetical protein VHV75_18410 [Solirubrobacteraceae bacterium]|jgi:hypothetical protein|nr:hypothetical protein [Solirubrobacteraceae bacterium]